MEDMMLSDGPVKAARGDSGEERLPIGHLSRLPVETLVEILAIVTRGQDSRELANLRLTSRGFKEAVSEAITTLRLATIMLWDSQDFSFVSRQWRQLNPIFSRLTSLTLRAHTVGSPGWSFLVETLRLTCTRLVELHLLQDEPCDLGSCWYAYLDVSGLRDIASLRTLTLASLGIPVVGLSRLSSVKSLVVSHPRIIDLKEADFTFESLRMSHALATTTIPRTARTLAYINLLVTYTTLTSLALENLTISGRFKLPPSVRTLSLVGIGAHPGAYPCLLSAVGSSNLTSLNLALISGNTEDFCKDVKLPSGLQSLKLSVCRDPNAFYMSFPTLPNVSLLSQLRNLEVINSDCDALPPLLHLASLQTLRLEKLEHLRVVPPLIGLVMLEEVHVIECKRVGEIFVGPSTRMFRV